MTTVLFAIGLLGLAWNAFRSVHASRQAHLGGSAARTISLRGGLQVFTSRLDSGHALGVFRLAEPNEPSDFNIFQASTIEFVDSRHLFDPALVVILDYEYASLHIAWARELPDLLPRTRRSTVVAVVTASEAARSILQEASWYVRGGWELLAAPHVAGATSEIERRLGRRLPISGALNGREE